MLKSVDGPRDGRLGGIEQFREELFGHIMPMVEQGRFQGLGQGECCWSAAWFTLGDVVGEGCEQRGELLVGERRLYAGGATVLPGAV